MDLNSVALATGIMAGMGAFLAFLLAVASRVFYVYEDPRIDQVDHLLPGANCGACGLPGCRAFAVGVVAGETAPGACTVAPEESRERIAALLGVAVGGEEKQVARLACAGGSHVARQRAAYVGEPTCRAADLVAGGGKGCSWGCLGLADCVTVCDFEALQMDSFALPVVDEVLCTACGDCVDICPKHLFSLRPVSQRLWVACQNLLFGDPAEQECAVACNACGKCVADAPPGLMSMQDNLARVRYEHNALAHPGIISRCPTGAIVWLDANQGPIKGLQAKIVVRQSALPLG